MTTWHTTTRMALLLLLTLAIGCSENPRGEVTRRPNIIYIMADDLGYGDLGCYGQQVIQTPAIDELAAQGMRFTDHYSGHTVCRCSRLSLWTGYHTGHLPIHGNAHHELGPREITVAKLLQSAGYHTGGIGKWSLGDTSTTGNPNRQGFDFWMGYLDQSQAHNYYPTHLWRNGETLNLPGNVLSEDPALKGRFSVKKTTWSHDLLADEALAFIRRNAEKPFLLHLHFTLPHANNEGGTAVGDGMEIPDYGLYADKDWPNPEKGFAAMVTRLDGDVGRIVNLLAELGIRENTVIFFTSDNGPHEEGGHRHDFFDSNGPLRGLKRDLYEGGIRVPLVVSWPGTIRPGSTSAYPSAFWDYLPTACEIAGVEAPQGIDGISYLPTLLGLAQRQHDHLYWKYEELGNHKAAVRAGSWKAVIPGTDLPAELYDLASDPGEANNLASENQAVLAPLVKIMTDMDGVEGH